MGGRPRAGGASGRARAGCVSGRAWAARAPGSGPWVIGHRGAAGAATENTLEAFTEAERQGADGVEFDVRPCRGGGLVVLHDADLARVSGGRDRRAAGDLEARAFAALPLAGGERAPLADEAVDWALARGLLVNVELKGDADRRAGRLRAARLRAASVLALARTLARFGYSRALLVSSFDPALLAGLRALAPRAQVGLLFQGRRAPWALGPPFARALHPERSLVTPARVAAAARRGALVCAWTVNEAAEARRLAAAGVDALITDRPADVRAALGAAHRPPGHSDGP